MEKAGAQLQKVDVAGDGPLARSPRPTWVPGSSRAKTYGSELSPIFQILTSGVIGNFPKNDAWLARGNVVQLLHMPVAASTHFPEKAHYRESLSLTVGLTVGFRMAAAANPSS
jgi:hypothetical protein